VHCVASFILAVVQHIQNHPEAITEATQSLVLCSEKFIESQGEWFEQLL
jgi:hypothetical protein